LYHSEPKQNYRHSTQDKLKLLLELCSSVILLSDYVNDLHLAENCVEVWVIRIWILTINVIYRNNDTFLTSFETIHGVAKDNPYM